MKKLNAGPETADKRMKSPDLSTGCRKSWSATGETNLFIQRREKTHKEVQQNMTHEEKIYKIKQETDKI